MDRQLAMRCFCRVVETGSFAAAARDLGIAPSVVTKTVQSLEAWTASRLLARTTRSLQLTPAGERFYAWCRDTLADTERMLAELRGASGALAGRIVVSVPVSLTLALLKDLLHDFQAQHPAVELELRLSDRPADLVREGVDLALRGQRAPEDSSLVATPLMTLARVVAAAPAYWAAHGRPAHPHELARHACLPYLLGSDAQRWRFTGPGGAAAEVGVQGPFRADNSLLVVDAMERGRGVGLVPRVLVQAALREGRLETALDDWTAETRRIYAVYAGRAQLPLRVRRLVQFLKERLAAAEAQPGG